MSETAALDMQDILQGQLLELQRTRVFCKADAPAHKVYHDLAQEFGVLRREQTGTNNRMKVKSDQLQWLPNGSELLMESSNPSTKPRSFTSFSSSQASLSQFSGKPIGMKHRDIIISKLGPGQSIELEAHAVKGTGKVHSKWSPVGTAWYRMLPEVKLLKEVKGNDADKLIKKCPVKVFDVEDVGHAVKKAVVSRPRDCTLCRECISGGGEENIVLRRVRDHFIFTVESTGALLPEVLFTEAVKILEEKCECVISELL